VQGGLASDMRGGCRLEFWVRYGGVAGNRLTKMDLVVVALLRRVAGGFWVPICGVTPGACCWLEFGCRRWGRGRLADD